MSTVDDVAPIEQLFDVVLSRDIQFHSEHQPNAANLFHDGKVLQLLQLCFEVRPRFADVSQQLLVLNDLEVFEAGPAGKRATAECRSMFAGFDLGRDVLLQDHGSHRNSKSQWFCAGNHIRQHCLVGWSDPLLKGKPLSCSTKTALNLIRDQKRSMLSRESPHSSIKIFAKRKDPAFALDGFNQNSTNIWGELLLEVRNVVRF